MHRVVFSLISLLTLLLSSAHAGESVFEGMIEVGGAANPDRQAVPMDFSGGVGFLYVPSAQFVGRRDSFRYGRMWVRNLIEDRVRIALRSGQPVLNVLADAGIHGVFFHLDREIERDEVNEIASVSMWTAGGAVNLDGEFRVSIEDNERFEGSYVVVFPSAWVNYFRVNPEALTEGGLVSAAVRLDIGPVGGVMTDSAGDAVGVGGASIEARGITQWILVPPAHGLELEAAGYGTANFAAWDQVPWIYGAEAALRYVNMDADGGRWFIEAAFTAEQAYEAGADDQRWGFETILSGGMRF